MKQDTKIKDYSLRFYVRDMYAKDAGKRGGKQFVPFYKKDLKPFEIRVKYAINQPYKILELAKYHFSNN